MDEELSTRDNLAALRAECIGPERLLSRALYRAACEGAHGDCIGEVHRLSGRYGRDVTLQHLLLLPEVAYQTIAGAFRVALKEQSETPEDVLTSGVRHANLWNGDPLWYCTVWAPKTWATDFLADAVQRRPLPPLPEEPPEPELHYSNPYDCWLIIRHPHMEPGVITETIGIIPFIKEPAHGDRHTRWECHEWGEAPSQVELCTEDVDLGGYLAVIVARLRPHGTFLNRIREEGGRVQLRVMFSVRRVVETGFDCELLAALADAGVDLDFSIEVFREANGNMESAEYFNRSHALRRRNAERRKELSSLPGVNLYLRKSRPGDDD